MTHETEIAYPVVKASAALGGGIGSSYAALHNVQPGSFLPVDLAGWLGAGASAVALLYSLHLLSEWWWKKYWRAKFEAWGWVKPQRKRARRPEDPDTEPAALT